MTDEEILEALKYCDKSDPEFVPSRFGMEWDGEYATSIDLRVEEDRVVLITINATLPGNSSDMSLDSIHDTVKMGDGNYFLTTDDNLTIFLGKEIGKDEKGHPQFDTFRYVPSEHKFIPEVLPD